MPSPSTPKGNAFAQDRGPAYWSARHGFRYTVCHQTIATNVTGQTSFDATTPTFLIYHTGGTKKLILSAMHLSQVGTVAGALINVLVASDRVVRYASGGTAVVAKPTFNSADTGNADIADVTPDFTFRYNPTSDAAVATTRYHYQWSITPNTTNPVPFSVDFEDGIIVGKTGAISIYTWAATTGPTWKFAFDVIEEK